MTRPYQVSRPAPLTLAERMEQKRQAKAQRLAEKEARQGVKQTLKYADLRYDYGQVEEQHRERVQMAALDILAHGEKLKQNIITIGKRLLEVKEIMPGKFTAWFIEEFNLSDRMAQNMMNVAREYGERPETVSGLSDSVLYVLAAPSTPPEVRLQVETAFKETGKAPSRTEVKRVVKAHKPEAAPSKIDIINRDLDSYEAEAAREVTAWLAPEPGRVTLRRELLLKMIDGATHKIFMPFLTRDEHDELLVALTRALEGDA